MNAADTLVWTGKAPWDGLGKEVSNKLTPKQMLVAAGLNWPVEKRELLYPTANGRGTIKIPGRYALVRGGTDERVLTIVGATYKPVQNEVAMDFFRKFVMASKMKMEIAGLLHGGQYIWALARLGPDFNLGKTDDIRSFLLLCQPHIFGKAMIVQYASVRVACWNIFTFNLGASIRGATTAFRMPHSIEFTDEVKSQAELAFTLAKKQMVEFKEAATLLSKKKATPQQIEEYFCEVLRFDPKLAAKKKTRKKNEQAVLEPRVLPILRRALEHGPGTKLATSKGTWWGALNAVTFTVDHELGRDQSASLRTAWFGAKASLKRRAIKLALERASS